MEELQPWQRSCSNSWKAPLALVLTRSHNGTCKICSVNRDVLLWLHTPLCSSANPRGNACQTLPPLYRCAACALTLSWVEESTSWHWDVALLFCVSSDKQCQLGFVTVPSKDEHPNPTDLNPKPSVNTEHPFPALCSEKPRQDLLHEVVVDKLRLTTLWDRNRWTGPSPC